MIMDQFWLYIRIVFESKSLLKLRYDGPIEPFIEAPIVYWYMTIFKLGVESEPGRPVEYKIRPYARISLPRNHAYVNGLFICSLCHMASINCEEHYERLLLESLIEANIV